MSGMAVRRKRATGGQMDMLQALLGPTDSPLVGAARSERTLMVWSFFALSKEHTTELPVYDDGRVRIEVVGTKHGVATMRGCSARSTGSISSRSRRKRPRPMSFR